jgi:hypothetical protein
MAVFVRMSLERFQPPKPFQAENDGSIPVTRSRALAKPVPAKIRVKNPWEFKNGRSRP